MLMKDNKIDWCKKQKKGIVLIEVNDNISAAYLKKAHNSLKAMDLNYSAKIIDWAVDAAYYARYQALYALLQKCGVKCEIHDCTMVVFRFLFSEHFDETFFKEIEIAKEQRINMTYYTDKFIPHEEIKENVDNAPNFVLEIEKYIDGVSLEELQQLRSKLI